MAKFTQCVYADANVFMRPFEIYRAALYNVYGGSRVTDVPYIIIIIYGLRAFASSMWGSLRLAPIILRVPGLETTRFCRVMRVALVTEQFSVKHPYTGRYQAISPYTTVAKLLRSDATGRLAEAQLLTSKVSREQLAANLITLQI